MHKHIISKKSNIKKANHMPISKQRLIPRIFIAKSCSLKSSHIGLCISDLLPIHPLCKKSRWGRGGKSNLILRSFLLHQVSKQNLLCHWKPCLLNVKSLNLPSKFFNVHEFHTVFCSTCNQFIWTNTYGELPQQALAHAFQITREIFIRICQH